MAEGEVTSDNAYPVRYQESPAKLTAHSSRIRYALSIRKDLLNDDISELLNYPLNEKGGIDTLSTLDITEPVVNGHLYHASKLQVVLSSNKILKIFIDLLSPNISNLIYAIQNKANYYEWDGKAVITRIMSLYSDKSSARFLAQEGEAENRLLTNTIKNYFLKKSKKLEIETKNTVIKKRIIRNELFCNNYNFDADNSSADYLYLNYLLSRAELVDEAIAFSDVSEELINSHKVYDRKCHSLRTGTTDVVEGIEKDLRALGALQKEEIERLYSDFSDIITNNNSVSRTEFLSHSRNEIVRAISTAVAGVSAALAAKERAGREAIVKYYSRALDADIERLKIDFNEQQRRVQNVVTTPPSVAMHSPVSDEERAAMQKATQDCLSQFQRFLCDVLNSSSKLSMQFVEDKYTDL